MADNRRERQDQLQLQVQEAARDLLGPGVASWVVSRFANHLLEQGRRQAIQGAAELGQITRNWIHQNAGHLGQNAWELAQDATTRAVEAFIEPDGFFGPRGAFAQWWDNTAQGAADTVGNALGINNDNNQLANQGPREIVDHPNNERRVRPREDSVPDISDLIPENSRNVRPRMEPTPAPTTEGARAGAAPAARGGSQVAKETPISYYPSLNYGLPETQTVVLPWVGWCTMAVKRDRTVTSGVSNDKPVVLRIRLNQPGVYIPQTMATTTLGGAFSNKGIYNVPADQGQDAAAYNYPSVLNVNGTGQTPQWLTWYGKQYEWYTVLSTEYEIVMVNPISQEGSALLIGTEFDSYTDLATSTGNVIPNDCTLVEAMNFKGMQWRHLGSSRNVTSDGRMEIIQGTHQPGRIKRNIINDGDVKTWTQTESTGVTKAPNLKDELVIMAWTHPLMSYGTATTICVNVQVRIKQIVQFKDLRTQLRYPSAANDTPLDIQLRSSNNIANDDIRMKPNLVVS